AVRREQDRHRRARAAGGGVLRRRGRAPVPGVGGAQPWPGRAARWGGGAAAPTVGLDELLDEVVARLPAMPDAPADEVGTRLALLGRPNVGKSSLLNSLLGAEHALVAPQAGTTRDHTDTAVRIDGRPYVLIDTAG